jgi:hypothetical protein
MSRKVLYGKTTMGSSLTAPLLRGAVAAARAKVAPVKPEPFALVSSSRDALRLL